MTRCRSLNRALARPECASRRPASILSTFIIAPACIRASCLSRRAWKGPAWWTRVGPDVSEVKPGDRVAYAMQQGAYAEYAVVPAWKLVPVPDGVDARMAGAVMLQGMTAHYLCYSTYPLGPGQTALVHAAAGGVGLLLVQWPSDAGRG